MAFRALFRQRAALPVAAGTLLASSAIFPISAVHAEGRSKAPEEPPKKPIYDDATPPPKPSTPSIATLPKSGASKTTIAEFRDNVPSPSETTPAPKPSPTDRLAAQIRRARLALFAVSTRAEGAVNNGMTRFLDAETNVAATIASLKPPPQANEPLLPGLVYMLVATMAGSIVSRNRNILLRASVPVLFGVAAGWVVIPVTMRNVGDLAWTYEKRFPAVAEAHLKAREKVEYFWETGKAHSAMTVQRAEGLVDDAREKVESWVKDGK